METRAQADEHPGFSSRSLRSQGKTASLASDDDVSSSTITSYEASEKAEVQVPAKENDDELSGFSTRGLRSLRQANAGSDGNLSYSTVGNSRESTINVTRSSKAPSSVVSDLDPNSLDKDVDGSVTDLTRDESYSEYSAVPVDQPNRSARKNPSVFEDDESEDENLWLWLKSRLEEEGSLRKEKRTRGKKPSKNESDRGGVDVDQERKGAKGDSNNNNRITLRQTKTGQDLDGTPKFVGKSEKARDSRTVSFDLPQSQPNTDDTTKKTLAHEISPATEHHVEILRGSEDDLLASDVSKILDIPEALSDDGSASDSSMGVYCEGICRRVDNIESKRKASCENKSQSPRKYRTATGVLCVVIPIVVLAIVVSTLVGKSSNRNSPVDSPTVAPFATSRPTSVPIKEIQDSASETSRLEQLITGAGITSKEQLYRGGPQAKAFTWLNQGNTTNEPGWRLVQRFALVTLYYSLGGPDWARKAGWLTNSPECEWFSRSSTSCRDGVFVEFTMVFNNVSGTLPPEIGLLTGLERLVMGGTIANGMKIFGSLPTSLGLCTNLHVVHLQRQALSGVLDDNMIRALPNLKLLDLSGNKLQGSLPASLGRASHLRKASLARNEFTGSIPQTYSDIAAQSLELNNNQLVGSIPSGPLHGLQLLDVSHNQLTTFPIDFNAPSLGTIQAGHNDLLGRLPDFRFSSLLKSVSLEHNSFSSRIPSEWVDLRDLEKVDLSFNTITGSVPEEITSLPNLGVLRIQGNEISQVTCPADTEVDWIADCAPGDGNQAPEIICHCCGSCCNADGMSCT